MKGLERLLERLKVGESIVLPGRKGWMIKLIKTQDGFDLKHFNPIKGDENQLKFYEYSTIGNPYGAGIVNQEPTLGVTCRSCGADRDGLIVGALIMEDHKFIERISLSNLVFVQDRSFRITFEGEFLIGDQSKGFLQGIFLADKNRISGFIGVFAPEKPKGGVKVLEMETLLLKYFG